MILKQDQQRVKDLLKETLTLLCKNGLHFNKNFVIEGLIGITLDDEEVFLINIKETIVTESVKSKTPANDLIERKQTNNLNKSAYSVQPIDISNTNLCDMANDSDTNQEVDESENITHFKQENIAKVNLITEKINTSQNLIEKSFESNYNSNDPQTLINTFKSNLQEFYIQANLETPTNCNLTSDERNRRKQDEEEEYDDNMDNFLSQSVDDKNVIHIKEEDEETESEDVSLQMFDEAGPSFQMYDNIFPTNQILLNQQSQCYTKASYKRENKKQGVIRKKKFSTVCLLCGLKCKQRRTLRAHMSLLHGYPREFKCNLCDKEFLYKNHLKVHIQVKHKIIMYKLR